MDRIKLKNIDRYDKKCSTKVPVRDSRIKLSKNKQNRKIREWTKIRSGQLANLMETNTRRYIE